MHGNEAEFLAGMSAFLGSYYIALAIMNAVAAFYVWNRLGRWGLALWWLAFSVFFVFLSPIGFSGSPRWIGYWWLGSLPPWVRDQANIYLGNAVVYSAGSMLVLVVLFFTRRWWVNPVVAWIMLNVSFYLLGLCMADRNFASIVTKPDNVPIVGLVFLLGFFTWLATWIAVQNDDRAREGLPPLEKLDDEKVLVWPDLVYTEMICMILLTAFLIVWAIGLVAPLEEPASSVKTPNPSKAPWYFLGLQEMLVYFDPWMAGVVLPSVVVFGLMAIPYLDFNKEGNGYYTIEKRKFAYIVFQIGFLEMWITLIILGTFLRGPNWNLFGPFEYWDTHKVEALNNINLSEIFWVERLNVGLPQPPSGATKFVQFGYIMLRESPGIILTLAYLTLLPPLMAMTVFRGFFLRMGFFRYMLMANMLLLMAALPIKMVLRWTFNLKYIIAIPEYFLNL